MLETALGSKASIEQLPMQPGDVDHSYADLTLSRRELGDEPSTDVRTGLARFVSWLRSLVGHAVRMPLPSGT